MGAICLTLLGLRFLWLDAPSAIPLQTVLGYPLVAGAFVCWCFFGWRMGCARQWWTTQAVRRNREVLIWALLGSAFLQVHEPHLMKVLYDEPTHAAMALVMHYEKTALMPGLSHYIGDRFVVGHFYPSFRAYLFPFLASLLSDLTGYRVSNLLVLNAGLGFGLLAVAGVIGRRIGGRVGGVAAILLLCGLPLLAQNVTSYGYDVLNVTLLSVLALMVVQLATDPDPGALTLTISFGTATGVLLAMSRYESILFLFPWVGSVAWRWWRDRAIVFPWYCAVAPVLLLPCFLSNLLMMGKGVDTYAGRFDSGVGFFSLSYLPGHAAQAFYYFSSFSRDNSGNVLLFVLGGLGLLFLIVRNAGGREQQLGGLCVISYWTLAMYSGMLTQFWSSPMDSVAARFTLPTWLVLALGAAYFLGQIDWLQRRAGVCASVLVAWGVLVSAPVSARAFATHTMPPSRVSLALLEYAQTRSRTRTLYVNYSNTFMIAQRYACQSIDRLNESPEAFLRAIKAGLYDEVLISQRIDLGSDMPGGQVHSGQELDARIVTEVLEERLIEFSHKSRISRLVGVRQSDGSLVTPHSDDEKVRLRTSFKDDADFRDYRLSLYP